MLGDGKATGSTQEWGVWAWVPAATTPGLPRSALLPTVRPAGWARREEPGACVRAGGPVPRCSDAGGGRALAGTGGAHGRCCAGGETARKLCAFAASSPLPDPSRARGGHSESCLPRRSTACVGRAATVGSARRVVTELGGCDGLRSLPCGRSGLPFRPSWKWKRPPGAVFQNSVFPE